MSLHPGFPSSPYAELIPEQRWFPADETLRATAYEKLLPPLVAKIRTEVFAWRHQGYAGASPSTRGLLKWWFETAHRLEKGREELDMPKKMARLRQWCADATTAEEARCRYDFLFVDQASFEKHAPKIRRARARHALFPFPQSLCRLGGEGRLHSQARSRPRDKQGASLQTHPREQCRRQPAFRFEAGVTSLVSCSSPMAT